ncbi:MAG TPA: hypothetical protein VGL91_16205 [Acidobacteriota bacterium]
MSKKLFAFAIISLLLTGYSELAGAPQQPKPQPAPGNPTDSPGTTRQPQPSPNSRQPAQRRLEQPIFLFGKVVIEDGSPLPEPVAVELLCNGQIRMRVYSQSKGDFSLEVGSRQSTPVFDASAGSTGISAGGTSPLDTGLGGPDFSGSLGRVDLTGCELRASLVGFQSSSIYLGFRRAFDRPDVGAITLRRLADVKGTTVSFNSLAAPEKAKKAYEKATKELSKKNPDRLKVAQELEIAVKEYPDYAAAWTLLGRNRLALKDKEGARQAFTNSMKADSKYIDPYLALAALEMEQGHWAEIVKLTNQIHELNPYVIQAQYLGGVANYQLDRLDQAEKSLLAVQQSSDGQRYPFTHYMLGAIEARRGDFASAALEFRRFLELRPDSDTTDRLSKMLADWEERGFIKKETAAKQK